MSVRLPNHDVEPAIAAHRAWRERLRQYIEADGQGTLTEVEVADDGACQLGKWLFSVGRDFDLLQEYSQLVEQHRNFHAMAAEIVRLQNSGQSKQARWVLDNPFEHQSDFIVRLLRSLSIDDF
jgi:methyl-accepting chemotaxis protein